MGEGPDHDSERWGDVEWVDVDTSNCSIRRALAVIGEKWTLLVIREAFNGVLRFDRMRNHLGVSEAVLADRLRTLVSRGVLATVPYREPGSRPRREYRLTDMGRALQPVLLSLTDWGDRYLSDSDGSLLEVVHRGCGAAATARVVCVEGHVLSSLREVDSLPGPGLRLRGGAA